MREPTIRKQNIHRNNLKIRLIFFGILALVLMGGCGGKPGAANGTETAFSVPDFQDASFHGEQAED